MDGLFVFAPNSATRQASNNVSDAETWKDWLARLSAAKMFVPPVMVTVPE